MSEDAHMQGRPVSKELTEASEKQQTFGPIQNVCREIRSMPARPPHLTCHYQLGHQGQKCHFWQYSHNTIIGPIKHVNPFYVLVL